MGTYADLSQADKDILAAWERNARGWVNHTISRGSVEARALKASLDAAGGAGGILNALDDKEVVPNSSGIAGAQGLTKEDWALLTSAGLDDYLMKYDNDAIREVAAKASGPAAGLS